MYSAQIRTFSNDAFSRTWTRVDISAETMNNPREEMRTTLEFNMKSKCCSVGLSEHREWYTDTKSRRLQDTHKVGCDFSWAGNGYQKIINQRKKRLNIQRPVR